jgi:hypothetical protein
VEAARDGHKITHLLEATQRFLCPMLYAINRFHSFAGMAPFLLSTLAIRNAASMARIEDGAAP